MLDFMIVGLPRSGTTWAANLFTTDFVLCHHDPLYHTHYSEWDEKFEAPVPVGVSCTGIWRWREWLNAHPARKLILERDIQSIYTSMTEIGMNVSMDELEDNEQALRQVIGLHVPHSDLFDPEKCCALWDYLMDGRAPFNWARHKLLVDIEMQPKFSGLSIGKEVTKRLMTELYSAMDSR